MEAISEQRLALVNPVLAAKVRAAHDTLLATHGFGFRVASGLRTYEEQQADYEKGRNGHPGKIVTNAPGGYSNHNFGCAVDCYPFFEGDSGGLDINDPNTLAFRLMVEALKAEGLAWGGDWESIKDYPHFQLANVPVTPTAEDREAFSRGGLTAVWAQYEQPSDTVNA